ncbi:RNA polymerase sigma factor [Kineosporia babensis]|uniref:Sigma-70 family RNA polymerase sigma factor n=1 Tax=Kineosporia babensis TaxID=499548 RepID=A0A9X1SW77_9ACTN|nr:sigma-70 family RNA polymerase sigma factor [Kineosporia babensis]
MSDSEWFRDVYIQTYADLTRFVVRRLHPPERAEDVVAEAFTVAWQRLGDLPDELDDARAWLFGITRRLLLAEHRADRRGRALAVRIAEHAAVDTLEHDDLVATSVDLVSSWQRLAPAQQEALSLSVWEGLSAGQAAAVLGISPVAFRIRLSRARRALQRHLSHVCAAGPSSLATSAEGHA